MQQEEGFLSTWLLYVLAPIALWGTAGYLQKVSTNHISGELSTLWFLAAFIPLGVILLAREPLPAQITATVWLLVIAQGFFLALGNYAVLAAFAVHGKASIISPLTSLYPVVSVPIALFFLGETINAREGSAIFLALLSVVALCRETPPRDQGQAIPAATQTLP